MTKVDSPNSTLSSATGKRAGCFRGGDVISDDDEGGSAGGGGGNNRDGSERKKLRLSKEQIIVLEQAFREHTTLNTKQKMTLARQVNLRPRQVEVWFQNRRARTKLKQTEVDCEYLRRFCESLTEQNRKLQKEVQELRSLKLPPGHGKNHPGSTVSMCPSCKAVSVSSSSAPSTNNGVLHRPIPLNLKKLSLTLNNNHNSNNNNNDNDNDKMLKSHLPHG
ncbi:hypothetical protein RND81_03G195500 [Saponaria officinalis]